MSRVGKDTLVRRNLDTAVLFLNLGPEHSLAIIGPEPLPALVAVHTEPPEFSTPPRAVNCTEEELDQIEESSP